MIFRKLAIATSLSLITSFVYANDALIELKAHLQKFDGFKASFSQKVTDFEGKLLQESQGELAVKKPNFIYWNTQQPDENLVVSDGSTLWYYEPFVEQVTAYAIDQAVSNTPILLLSNPDSDLWQDFDVIKNSDNSYSVNAKKAGSQVKTLVLSFKNDVISEFVVTDATEQRSVFQLSQVVTDTLPQDSLFQFTIPENVVVDDQRNP